MTDALIHYTVNEIWNDHGKASLAPFRNIEVKYVEPEYEIRTLTSRIPRARRMRLVVEVPTWNGYTLDAIRDLLTVLDPAGIALEVNTYRY